MNKKCEIIITCAECECGEELDFPNKSYLVCEKCNKKINWINVKDRLPENKEIVLAGNINEMAVCKFEKTEWEYFFILKDTSYQIRDITHWSTLPEFPK